MKTSEPQKAYKPPSLASLVTSKISAGDVKGALRLASSDNSVLIPSQELKSKLEKKHPKPPNDTKIPINQLPSVLCDRKSVLKCIRSFPPGSNGGPDGLKPQILKDLSQDSLGEDSKN